MRVPESMSECDERISKDRYGCFTVLFSNSNGLEEEDICDIFAQFGQYLSIRKAGNKNGIHFVTYETYEEAKRAVDGLENHPDVQLKVYYRKKRRNHFNYGYNNNNNNYNRWSNEGYASNGRQYNEPNYARGEECIENGGNREFNRESSIWNETISACEDSDDSIKKFVNGASDNYCETSEFTEDEKSSAYTWLNVQNYLASSCNNNNNNNNTRESESVETIAATINTEGEEFVKCQEEGDAQSQVLIAEDDKASTISSAIMQEEKEEEEDSTSIIQEIVYAKASQVVVGNVDLRLNEAYLLHLFNEYEPIAISQLVPLRRGQACYCYVYFKNEDVALKVERSFDKLCLYGRQLVVQRPRRLIAAYLDQL